MSEQMEDEPKWSSRIESFAIGEHDALDEFNKALEVAVDEIGKRLVVAVMHFEAVIEKDAY